MWKKLPNVGKQELSDLRGMKRMKLYADEDIEEEIVDFFREKGINITSAREMGHRGKPDSFHAALSYREKRFLLTKNAKHYFNNRDIPFHRIYGIIALEGDMSDISAYARTLHRVFDLIPYSEVYIGNKIQVSPNEISLRFIDKAGALGITRFKVDSRNVYEWVE